MAMSNAICVVTHFTLCVSASQLTCPTLANRANRNTTRPGPRVCAASAIMTSSRTGSVAMCVRRGTIKSALGLTSEPSNRSTYVQRYLTLTPAQLINSQKCGANDLAILCRTLQTADYKLLVSSFSKLRSSKYAWPFNQSSQIPVSMNRIIQKIGLNSYTTFKEFMDEMIDMFQRFRDHFDQNGSHSSKEVGLI